MEFTDKYDLEEGAKLSWPLKLLFFIGGQMTMGSIFTPFLLIFEDMGGYIFFGLCMLVGAIVMTRMVDNEKLILAVAYPLYLTGHSMFMVGLEEYHIIENINVFAILNLCIFIAAWIFCRNHFMRQLFLLSIFSVIPWLFSPEHHYDNSIRDIFFYYSIFLMAVYALTIVFDADYFSEENLYTTYIPTIRFCSVVTAIGYALFGIDSIVQSIICAVFSFVVACVLLSKRMKDTKRFVVCIGVILLGCVASSITPNISLALLGLILAYTVLDYFGVAVWGVFLVYSIGKFYYDLDMLLVHKSYLLMGSGVIFLSIFFSIKKLIK